MTDSSPGRARLWRRLWRNAYWFRADRHLHREYAGIRHLLLFGGQGIGDELLLSTAAHELRARGTEGIGVMTHAPEFFRHSPDVDVVKPMRLDHVNLLPRIGITVRHLGYIARQEPPDIDVPPPRHLLAEMCRLAGARGPVALRPYLFLQPEERAAVRRDRPYWVVHSSRRSASFTLDNKEWFPERFQAVIDRLRGRIHFIQLGHPAEPALAGVEDLRGRTTLRESAALLAGADGLVGLVGLVMHLARAVDCPGVILYGGREHPDQSGYPANENLYRPVPCAPCWRRSSCDHEHICMTSIAVNDVLAAIERVAAHARARPLPAATADVG